MHKHLQHVPMSDIGSKVGPSHFFSTDFSTTTKEVATITKEVPTITKEVPTIIKEVPTITKEVTTITKEVAIITKEVAGWLPLNQTVFFQTVLFQTVCSKCTRLVHLLSFASFSDS